MTTNKCKHQNNLVRNFAMIHTKNTRIEIRGTTCIDCGEIIKEERMNPTCGICGHKCDNNDDRCCECNGKLISLETINTQNKRT